MHLGVIKLVQKASFINLLVPGVKNGQTGVSKIFFTNNTIFFPFSLRFINTRSNIQMLSCSSRVKRCNFAIKSLRLCNSFILSTYRYVPMVWIIFIKLLFQWTMNVIIKSEKLVHSQKLELFGLQGNNSSSDSMKHKASPLHNPWQST